VVRGCLSVGNLFGADSRFMTVRLQFYDRLIR
jgi:peptide deformylase